MNLFQIGEQSLINLVLAKIVATLICDESLVIREDQSLVIVVLVMGRNRAQSESKASSHMDNCHEVILFS